MVSLEDFSKKNFKEIDKVRQNFKREVIDKIGSNNTILLYGKYYEALFYEELRMNGGKIKTNDSKRRLSIAEIIKWVTLDSFVEDIDEVKIEEKTVEKYFLLAYQVEQSSTAYLSNHSGIFNVRILSEKKLEFKYVSKEVEVMEDINHILITEYNEAKGRKIDKALQEAKSQGINLNSNFRANAVNQVNFELPDDYKLLDSFSIKHIKEFWANINKIVMDKNKENGDYFKDFVINDRELMINDIYGLEIVDIDLTTWSLNNLTIEQAKELLDIFSYNGIRKLGSINSTFITEPIVKMPDGSYKIFPSIMSYYQPERYSMQVFDKLIHYKQKKKEKVETDDFKRESIFTDKLNNCFQAFRYKADTVKINDTDIDYMVYDEVSKTVICFETKWLTEPLTPIEITSKDEAIRKALEVQLPKYKDEMETNTIELLKKAFGNDFNEIPNNFYYFVLTNLSIGSGLLDRKTFKVINYRMLQKSVKDSNNNLLSVSQSLFSERRYLPNPKKYIESVTAKTECFGVEIRQPEMKYIGGFSLD